MTDDLHLADDLIRELEGMALRTSQGSYVKMEDVRRLIEKRQESKAVTDAIPEPKTIEEARSQAKKYLAENGSIVGQPKEPSRAIPATEPQSPSRA